MNEKQATRPSMATSSSEGSGEVQRPEGSERGYKSQTEVMQTSRNGRHLHLARDGRYSWQDKCGRLRVSIGGLVSANRGSKPHLASQVAHADPITLVHRPFCLCFLRPRSTRWPLPAIPAEGVEVSESACLFHLTNGRVLVVPCHGFRFRPVECHTRDI